VTADGIRSNYQSDKPCFDPADAASVFLAQLEIQAEIAAQLAELNENIKNFLPYEK